MSQTQPLPGLPRHVPVIRSEACGNCKHAVRQRGQMFECRRNPPTAALMQNPKTGEPMPISFFAPVQGDHWCGEFARRIIMDS